MYKMDLEKAEEPEIKLPTFVGSYRKQGDSRKIPTFASLTMQKFLTVDNSKLWKIIKEIRIPDHLISLLWHLYEVKKQQLELDMEQQTGSISGKEYFRAVYCHPAYLTYMQSASCEMLGWMNHKLESRLPGEISTTSDMQMIPL